MTMNLNLCQESINHSKYLQLFSLVNYINLQALLTHVYLVLKLSDQFVGRMLGNPIKRCDWLEDRKRRGSRDEPSNIFEVLGPRAIFNKDTKCSTSWNILNYLRHFETLWHHLRLFKTILDTWNKLGPFEPYQPFFFLPF